LTLAGAMAMTGSGWINTAGWVIGFLFAVFLIQTVIKAMTRIEVNALGLIVHGPLTRRFAWTDLTGFKLAFFPAGPKSKWGWMILRLTIKDDPRALMFDSTLEDFERLLARVAHATEHLEMDPATKRNLARYGL
ncbi:MAG: hypothetical protein U9N14_04740, partial [Pseudomonadota bacterium]|nr:hypothetical protein [Pseudomonadota bacterium]